MFGYWAPSPGNTQHDLPLSPERLRLVVDARDVLDATAAGLLELLDRALELRRKVVERRGDDRQAHAVLGALASHSSACRRGR